MKTNTTVISIDPGFDRVGWAVGRISGNNYTLVAAGCLETNKKTTIFDRYGEILQGLEEILSQHTPLEAAIETLYFSKNRKTAIRVSEARGLIIGTLMKHQLSIFEYHPGEVKLAVTGYGNADKPAIAKMVRLQTNLNHDKLIDDAIDAIAVGMTHAITAGMRQATEQTKATLNKARSS